MPNKILRLTICSYNLSHSISLLVSFYFKKIPKLMTLFWITKICTTALGQMTSNVLTKSRAKEDLDYGT